MALAALQRAKHARSVLDLIGNTPMVRFKRIGKDLPGVELLAKAEWYNPGGSVKDRAALSMILDGERRLVRANDVTYIPPGVVHEFHCTGTDPLVFLVITSPPTDEEPKRH